MAGPAMGVRPAFGKRERACLVSFGRPGLTSCICLFLSITPHGVLGWNTGGPRRLVLCSRVSAFVGTQFRLLTAHSEVISRPGSFVLSRKGLLTDVSHVCPIATWLILPVVICLSQRLSHACLSTNFYIVKPRMAH